MCIFGQLRSNMVDNNETNSFISRTDFPIIRDKDTQRVHGGRISSSCSLATECSKPFSRHEYFSSIYLVLFSAITIFRVPKFTWKRKIATVTPTMDVSWPVLQNAVLTPRCPRDPISPCPRSLPCCTTLRGDFLISSLINGKNSRGWVLLSGKHFNEKVSRCFVCKQNT